MLRLLADENFPGSALSGLLRRKPEMDVIRVQDFGLMSEADPVILEWAVAQERILISLDSSTVPGHAFERIANGQPMAGVFIFSDRMSIRQIIEELNVVDECTSNEEWIGRVAHFPY
jgi:predicted nuclease of predicted toxin-antitoxin system